jgi:hypothetical protein
VQEAEAWWEWYHQARLYKQRHQRLPPGRGVEPAKTAAAAGGGGQPQNGSGDTSTPDQLAAWLAEQAALHVAGRLSKERSKKLRQLGFKLL